MINSQLTLRFYYEVLLTITIVIMGYRKQGFRLNKGASGFEEKLDYQDLKNAYRLLNRNKVTMFPGFCTINKRAKLT